MESEREATQQATNEEEESESATGEPPDANEPADSHGAPPAR